MSEVNFRKIIAAAEGEDILRLANVALKTCDGCVFPVHNVILARKNDYFRKLFCCFSAEDRKEFLIPGVSGEILSLILIYLYTRKCSVTTHNIANLIVGADYLCVSDLIKYIENDYEDKITVSNSLSLLLCSDQINSVGFFNKNLRFIQSHFEQIVNNCKTQFSEVPLPLLSTLLRSGGLNICDERLVWSVIAEWVQKDIQNRLPDVPFLLKHLARKEIDETLSREVMSHNIVKNNSHCKISSDYKSENSLQSFLDMNLDSFLDYRIPAKLHVIAKKVKSENFTGCHIYVTCDETLDMRRKIAEVEFHSITENEFEFTIVREYMHIVPMQNNLYIFLMDGNCLRLDLEENSQIQMSTFSPSRNAFNWEVVENRRLIYVIGSMDHTPDVQIFDPETNLWRTGKPHFYVHFFQAASISGKIYVVGGAEHVRVQVYDPESDTWSVLPSSRGLYPNIDIVIHREKFFVIGGPGGHTNSVEIFEPSIGNWRQVAELPRPSLFSNVLNDQIIVHELIVYEKRTAAFEDIGQDSNKNVFCWQDDQECWGEGRLHPLLNYYRYAYWEVHESETIRCLNKGDHYRNIEPERCCSKLTHSSAK